MRMAFCPNVVSRMGDRHFTAKKFKYELACAWCVTMKEDMRFSGERRYGSRSLMARRARRSFQLVLATLRKVFAASRNPPRSDQQQAGKSCPRSNCPGDWPSR